MKTALYRHFADDGSLLYIGISLSWPIRTKTHSTQAHWFDQVTKVEIEYFSSRQEALAAERDAIKRERPKFNVIHNRDSVQKPNPSHMMKPWHTPSGDPLFATIKGPDALVGPALVYRDENISFMVAHGDFGAPGQVTEINLGRFYDDSRTAWMDICKTVLVMRRADDITMCEAIDVRKSFIARLRSCLRHVEVYDNEYSLTVAYASRFPSTESRRLLNEIAIDHVGDV